MLLLLLPSTTSGTLAGVNRRPLLLLEYLQLLHEAPKRSIQNVVEIVPIYFCLKGDERRTNLVRMSGRTSSEH